MALTSAWTSESNGLKRGELEDIADVQDTQAHENATTDIWMSSDLPTTNAINHIPTTTNTSPTDMAWKTDAYPTPDHP
jgi:hypothetical protein